MHRRTSAIPLILLGLALLGGIPGDAGAEAPFYYDDLYDVSFYDPNFQPMFRPTGYLAFLAQGWTYANVPGESLQDQNLRGEYRLRWSVGLDEAYSALLIEGKAAQQKNIVPEDYFLKLEYIYRGLKAPLWLYGGARLIEDADAVLYGGVETMAFHVADLLKTTSRKLPLAFKGFAEVRYNPDVENNPSLRLMAMVMNPKGSLGLVTLALPVDMTFAENEKPIYLLSPHLDVTVLKGFLQVDLVSGFSVELKEDGEQRASIGIRAGFGPPGGMEYVEVSPGLP